MVDNQLQRRRKLYFELSSQIAQIDNAQLRSLLGKSETNSSWGQANTIDVRRSKVFVKRVPVTNIEYDNMFSTRNVYDLPTYYNYGLNSAGLGVFRELVTHIKTTNWVLEGVIATFPLLYHYRIIPFAGVRAEVDQERHADYVAYWGNDANVGKYLLDRASANYELVLFLEYIPHTVATWLLDNPTKTPLVMADMQATITFLRNNGIIHLDSHFDNMLTDGKRVYLTDFGLALDKHFELAPAEQQFYRQNSYYDYGLLLWSLGSHLLWMYRSLPDADKNHISKKYGIRAGVEFEELMSILLNNINEIDMDGIMQMDRDYLVSLTKYRSVIILMHDFYSNMRKNNAKDTRLDHVTLRRLLKETGFLPCPVSSG
jgi:hypothetical protein